MLAVVVVRAMRIAARYIPRGSDARTNPISKRFTAALCQGRLGCRTTHQRTTSRIAETDSAITA